MHPRACCGTHAIATKTSLSKAVGDLLRRNLGAGSSSSAPSAAHSDASFLIDPETLLPVVRGDGRALTAAAVQRAIDEELSTFWPDATLLIPV